MPTRTLADLSLGATVKIYETVDGTESPAEYYLLKKNALNCILLRKETVQAKRMHSSAVANYPDAIGEGEGTGAVCEMDKFLCGDFQNRYSTAMKACLTPETIKYYDLNCYYGTEPRTIEISRRVFLLSSTELGYRTTPDEGDSIFDALCAATGKTGNAARIAYNSSSAAVNWWLRSAHSASYFRGVHNGGYEVNFSATIASVWLRPALSVAAATLVSPEGDDIYLLPDPDKPYREVAGTAILGTTANRPIKAKLMCEVTGMDDYDLQICNNANDDSPAWEDVTVGVEHTFENETKTDENWAIGFKFYGKSTTIGKIESPMILDIEEAGT